MIFNSLQYLIFFPIVTLIYFIVPNKIKHIWLLASSYYFYMCWNVKYLVLILFSTLITYFCANFIQILKKYNKNIKYLSHLKKYCIIVCFILNFSLLFYFKYINFVFENFQRVLNILNIKLEIPEADIILPVGISFYTFQALGYIIDVYRNEIKAEKNLLRYALFVSFFPQLVAGPIERSKNLLIQLHNNTKFNTNNARAGLIDMVYGLMLKIIIADNISLVITPIFSNPAQYEGMECFMAAILFAFQIYCDFNGYTIMAVGSAKILGYHLSDNFNSPYMAVSVKDFWKRWHISLTSWFRDYLYISLGGSKKGKIKKQINTLIVFLCSGFWHGAAWHYIVWGG